MYGRRNISTGEYREVKGKINELFKSLRKQKVTARQNFACCGSCAGYELATDLPNLTPVVFYNRQAGARAQETGRFTVAYGLTSKSGEEVEPTPEDNHFVGLQIAGIATQLGLAVDWNGHPDETITLS